MTSLHRDRKYWRRGLTQGDEMIDGDDDTTFWKQTNTVSDKAKADV